MLIQSGLFSPVLLSLWKIVIRNHGYMNTNMNTSVYVDVRCQEPIAQGARGRNSVFG